MNNSAQNQKGIIDPKLIIGGVIALVVIFFLATGNFKFSATRTDQAQESQPQEDQVQETTQQEQPKSETLDLSENYTHSSPAFSFKYPNNWGLDAKEKQVTVFSKDDGADNAKDSPAGLVVSVTPLSGELAGKKIATLGDLLKDQLGKQFPNATINESMETKLGTNDSFVYKFVYPNKTADFQSNMYLLTDGSNLYTLFITARKDRFEKYEPTLQAIAETFTLP